MKLRLFTDKIGRIIVGEELETQQDSIKIKNPVICNLVDKGPNTPPQLSILPYVFIELFDLNKHDDYIVSFHLADITFIDSVNGGDTNNLHANLISNYTKLFDNVRAFKNANNTKSNTVEVE